MTSTTTEAKTLDAVAERVISKWSMVELPSPVDSPLVRSAQRFLTAAQDTVSLAFLNFRLSREFTKVMDQKDARGRLRNSEMDLLRAAIVFAGAGLDATLKELIRCALPAVIAANEQASKRFQAFAKEHLGAGRNVVDFESLADVLTSPQGAREALLRSYAHELTGDSLQSTSQVSKVASALGISDQSLRKRIGDRSPLDQMFRARQQIVHELDLTGSGVRSRKIETAESWVREALSVGQEVVNAVARETTASLPSSRRSRRGGGGKPAPRA